MRERESRTLMTQFAPFRVVVREQDGLVCVRLEGEFVRSAIPQVDYALATASPRRFRRVLFDLSGLTFMDAPALVRILKEDQRGRHEDFDVVIVRPPPLASRIFTLTPVAEKLRVVDHAWQAEVESSG
jgi:anti-anti-sigma factor